MTVKKPLSKDGGAEEAVQPPNQNEDAQEPLTEDGYATQNLSQDGYGTPENDNAGNWLGSSMEQEVAPTPLFEGDFVDVGSDNAEGVKGKRNNGETTRGTPNTPPPKHFCVVKRCKPPTPVAGPREACINCVKLVEEWGATLDTTVESTDNGLAPIPPLPEGGKTEMTTEEQSKELRDFTRHELEQYLEAEEEEKAKARKSWNMTDLECRAVLQDILKAEEKEAEEQLARQEQGRPVQPPPGGTPVESSWLDGVFYPATLLEVRHKDPFYLIKWNGEPDLSADPAGLDGPQGRTAWVNCYRKEDEPNVLYTTAPSNLRRGDIFRPPNVEGKYKILIITHGIYAPEETDAAGKNMAEHGARNGVKAELFGQQGDESEESDSEYFRFTEEDLTKLKERESKNKPGSNNNTKKRENESNSSTNNMNGNENEGKKATVKSEIKEEEEEKGSGIWWRCNLGNGCTRPHAIIMNSEEDKEKKMVSHLSLHGIARATTEGKTPGVNVKQEKQEEQDAQDPWTLPVAGERPRSRSPLDQEQQQPQPQQQPQQQVPNGMMGAPSQAFPCAKGLCNPVLHFLLAGTTCTACFEGTSGGTQQAECRMCETAIPADGAELCPPCALEEERAVGAADGETERPPYPGEEAHDFIRTWLRPGDYYYKLGRQFLVLEIVENNVVVMAESNGRLQEERRNAAKVRLVVDNTTGTMWTGQGTQDHTPSPRRRRNRKGKGRGKGWKGKMLHAIHGTDSWQGHIDYVNGGAEQAAGGGGKGGQPPQKGGAGKGKGFDKGIGKGNPPQYQDPNANGIIPVCCFFARRGWCRYNADCQFAHMFRPVVAQCDRQLSRRHFCRHHGHRGVWY